MALMLSSRPDLGWRDVQGVLVQAAVPFGPTLRNQTDGWQKTQSGLYFHHRFGFGKADAHRMVKLAQSWTPVKSHVVKTLPRMIINRPIPLSLEKRKKCISFTFMVNNDPKSSDYIEKLEHVTIMIDVKFGGGRKRGLLEVAYLDI